MSFAGPLGLLRYRTPTARWRSAVLSIVVALTIAACASGEEPRADDVLHARDMEGEPDPGLVHVHGLGVNAADRLLYVATHFGLWRLPEEGPAERVGDGHQDLMGFTVVGPDHFVASGHPALTDDLPPLLGLIESVDGGETWQSVSLLGEADFHALRAEHDRVYGWNASDGTFMVSQERREWEPRSTHESLLDFVVDPDDPLHLIAAQAGADGSASGLRSNDGGRSWEPLDGPGLVRLSWSSPERLWGAGVAGDVWHSADGGQTWQRTGEIGGVPEALLDTGETLVTSLAGVISESSDGGETWEERYRDAD